MQGRLKLLWILCALLVRTRILLTILVALLLGLAARQTHAVQRSARAKRPAAVSTAVRKGSTPARRAATAKRPAQVRSAGRAQRAGTTRKSGPARLRKASLTTKPSGPSLHGSLDSMKRQNETVAAEGLDRIEDEKELKDKIARKELVALPASNVLAVHEKLAEDRRFCSPWTATFLTDLAKSFAATFHKPLTVSSAVRTVDYQKQLRRRNGNAAAAEGDVVSPHVTGAAVDITKKEMSAKELAWMRARLLDLVKQGKADVAEEFKQSCFHITVYKNYLPAAPVQKVVTPQKSAPAQPVASPSFLAKFFEGF